MLQESGRIFTDNKTSISLMLFCHLVEKQLIMEKTVYPIEMAMNHGSAQHPHMGSMGVAHFPPIHNCPFISSSAPLSPISSVQLSAHRTATGFPAPPRLRGRLQEEVEERSVCCCQ